MKRFTILILAFVGVIGIRAEGPAQLVDKDLVLTLQKGGYVIYMRHPRTNPDQADTDPLNLDNIKAQRHLTDEGRKQAKAVGEAFRTLKIPVDRVISSKFYVRTKRQSYSALPKSRLPLMFPREAWWFLPTRITVARKPFGNCWGHHRQPAKIR